MMQEIKAQFPQADDICYLNHAAVSPWPLSTAKAVQDFTQENVTRGAQHYPKWLQQEQQLRQNLKALIHAESTDEIALAKSTSEALSIIAYGINWQNGDEVIISNMEFPSNRIVWESLAQFGVKLVVADIQDTDPADSILAKLSSRTKLVAISSVQYTNGLSVDLEKLSSACRLNNTLLCVDAIQSLGAVPFNQSIIQADFIVADGHKWLMAAEGLALMYIKKEHIQSLKLHQYGWHMVADRGNYDTKIWKPADTAMRFECGSPNMLGIHALNASLKLILELGVEQIFQQLQSRVTFLEKNLRELEGISFNSLTSGKPQSGIVNFSFLNRDSNSLYKALMSRGVICAHRGGGIRFSPHFYTSEATLLKAVSIVKDLLES